MTCGQERGELPALSRPETRRLAQALGLGPAAAAGSPPVAWCAPAMLREAVTRPPARPGANAGARSSTRPPCAPTPGSRNVACGISSRARARCAGTVAPTTAPTSLRPDSPTPGAPSSLDDRGQALPDRPAAGELEVLDVGGARVRRAHQREHPGARGARRRHERLDRVRAHQRVDRHHVRAETLDRAERRLEPADQALRVGGGAHRRCRRACRRRSRAGRLPARARRPPPSALQPGAPSRSKHASWGLTATQASAVASIRALQWPDRARGALAAASPRRAAGDAAPPAGSARARSQPATARSDRDRCRARSATRASATRAARVSPKLRRQCQRPFTALFSPLPAVKRGTREAAIWMRSPVRGLTPAARRAR